MHPTKEEARDTQSAEDILSEARRLTNSDRQKAYGHPIEDFSRAGRMWAAILNKPEITPQQVALCMIAVKISREVNRPKRDNRVDIAGYVNCLDMVERRLDIKQQPQPQTRALQAERSPDAADDTY